MKQQWIACGLEVHDGILLFVVEGREGIKVLDGRQKSQ
jgi:hypothetical protein